LSPKRPIVAPTIRHAESSAGIRNIFGLTLFSPWIVLANSALFCSLSERSFVKYPRQLVDRRRNAIVLGPTRKYGNLFGSESIIAPAINGVSAMTTIVRVGQIGLSRSMPRALID